MKRELKKHLPLFEYLIALTPSKRASTLQTLKSDVYQFIFDLLFNLNQGVVPVPDLVIEQLRPYKRVIKSLTVKQKSLKQRKKEFLKKDYFSKLFAPLLPVLRNLS